MVKQSCDTANFNDVLVSATTVHSILGNVLWPTNKARLGDPRDSTLVTRLPGRKQG